MSESELTTFARKHNVTYSRAQQIEAQALSKVVALTMAQSFDHLDRTDLRLLIHHCRNALSRSPRHPREIVERFREREELLKGGRI